MAAEGAHRSAELRRCCQPAKNIGLVDLEAVVLGRGQAWRMPDGAVDVGIYLTVSGCPLRETITSNVTEQAVKMNVVLRASQNSESENTFE